MLSRLNTVLVAFVVSLLVSAAIVVAQTSAPSTIQPSVITGSSQIPTYAGTVTALSNVAASDIYCVTGSDTKVVKVTGFCINAGADNASIINVTVVLRSALNSGGGMAEVPIVKFDQLNPAPTAKAYSFTSAPTAGAAIGTVRSYKYILEGTNQAGRTCQGATVFPRNYGQPIVLRGSTQQACINSSALGAGGNWNIVHDHTEE